MAYAKKALYRCRLACENGVLPNLQRLRQWQWASADEIEAIRRTRIEALLRHAYAHVPYYREIMRAAGIAGPETVRADRFGEIPFLDKSILRTRGADLRSDDLNARRWRYNTSGGSTGEPVRFIQDKHYRSWARAGKMLCDEWTGYHPASGRVRLWGSERDLMIGRQTLRTRLGRWVANEVYLNAYRITPADMRSYVERINALRPVQILAYVESLYDLARFVERAGIEMRSPKAILLSAGTLLPHMRETIERVFQAPVFNRYGSREVGDMAWECDQRNGLHTCVPNHVIELVDKRGKPVPPGVEGEIIVTSLTNYAMPLIRYRIGDKGVWARGPCPCGRKWPMLEQVTGRILDTMVRRDGTQVQGHALNRCLYFRDWVKRSQFIQEDYDDVRVRIEPTRGPDGAPASPDEAEIEEFRAHVSRLLGGNCHVTVEFVDEIAPTASGKYRYVISRFAESDAGPDPEGGQRQTGGTGDHGT